MKPEHTRPFNLEHARAGAPLCCANGEKVEILTWDRKHILPIIGIINNHGQDVMGWNANGTNANDNGVHLVMTPLGFIDGKPVFVGDEIETNLFGGGWKRGIIQPGDHGFSSGCRWPAYPETLITTLELATAGKASLPQLACERYDSEARAIANAAIRRAINDGQVVRKDDHEAALQYLGDSLRGIAIQREALRDLAIAETVHRAHVNGQYSIPGAWDLDLASLIATVK